MAVDHERLYRQRFADVSQRNRTALWEVLCRVVLQRYVRSTDIVLDLGAGFGEFINTIRCSRKIAVDTNPAVRTRVAADVTTVVGEIPAVLTEIADASVNLVFCSNLLEHMPDKDAVLAVLGAVRRLLVPSGRLIVIQPNIRYAYKEYWDFFDHHVALSHASLSEALQIIGFDIEEARPRFLPYTTKSRVPQAAWLLRLYLALPVAQSMFGKQMMIVARKRVED